MQLFGLILLFYKVWFNSNSVSFLMDLCGFGAVNLSFFFNLPHGSHVVIATLRQPAASLLVKTAFFDMFFVRIRIKVIAIGVFLWVYDYAHVVRNV